MQKSVSNTLIKIAVCLLAIKEFWLLLAIPSFSNAVISFLTVGAVPGTSHTLSPAQIYWMVGVIFVCAIVALFRKDIKSVFVARRDRKDYAKAYITPISHPYDSIKVISPTEAMAVAPRGPRGARQHQELIRSVTVRLQRFGKLSGHWLHMFAARVTHIALRISKMGAKWLRLGMRWIKRLSILYWREAEPYIRTFDAWLEKKLHQYEHTSALLSIGGEMTATVRKLAKNAQEIAKEARQSAASEQKQS